MANSQEELNQLFLKYPRLGGLFCTLFGLVVGCLAILFPIQQVDSGANTIYISTKLIFLSELNLLIGLPALIFGANCKKVFIIFKIFKIFKRPSSNRPRSINLELSVVYVLTFILSAIMAALLIFTDSLIKGWLESRGYTIR